MSNTARAHLGLRGPLTIPRLETSLPRWVHHQLLAFYGPAAWPRTYAPLDELVATILSQHTSDINSDRAFAALRRSYPTWQAVRDAPLDGLIETIRAGGLAVVKAERIQAVLRALTTRTGEVHLPDLRRMRRPTAI